VSHVLVFLILPYQCIYRVVSPYLCLWRCFINDHLPKNYFHYNNINNSITWIIYHFSFSSTEKIYGKKQIFEGNFKSLGFYF
jgi:hypothetical protein